MQFNVLALTDDQTVTSLTIDAVDEQDARRQIEGRGLYVAEIGPVNRLGRALFSSKTLSLILFSQELLALLNAGLSIVESLEALLEKETNVATRSTLMRLLSGLREGQRFSTVLAEQPDLFGPLYIGIVRAAEGTSELPRSLERFIDYQQRVDAVRNRIISAAIYLLILLVVGACVTLFLIAYVVPRFAEVYRSAGRHLPWMSQLLLSWGNYVAAYPGQVATGLIAFTAGLFFLCRSLIRSGAVTRLAYRLPGIGERLRIVELVRLYLTLGMLLDGGIPIVAALTAVQDVVSMATQTAIHQAMLMIQSGRSLSQAFEENKLTTPISLRMLRVGERSGEAAAMLTQSATFYDGEITRWIERFSRIFEPALMTLIGLVIGSIVVLLYMPIFDLAGSF